MPVDKDYIMKAIKLVSKNESIINAALKTINGKALEHTLSSASELIDEVIYAESKLIKLIPKKHCAGAKYYIVSGNKLPTSYKYTRKVTSLSLLRRSTGWWLVSGSCFDQWPNQGSHSRLTLTKEQGIKAVALWQKNAQFTISENTNV
jgi:hypothetical protein